MPSSDRFAQRIPLIAALIAHTPSGFGRTALMKCLYFLQILREVPLGYHFQLYTYGPFDSDVLGDLGLAERLGAVSSELLQYPGGHRYELRTGVNAEKTITAASDFISRHQDDIDWVVQCFGGRSAVDLENASTLIFTDRSVAERGERLTLSDLVGKVHAVKPHLSTRMIENEARNLMEKGLLRATA